MGMDLIHAHFLLMRPAARTRMEWRSPVVPVAGVTHLSPGLHRKAESEGASDEIKSCETDFLHQRCQRK